MDEVELIRDRTRRAWDWLEMVVGDVSPERANWIPPGTANSIAAGYLHILINTDVEIRRIMYGREPLVERDWRGDVGQGVPYDPPQFDAWPPRDTQMDWSRLRAYGRAVHEWLLGEAVPALTAADLALPVDMTRSGLGIWTGRELWCLHGFDHPRIHGGEIAALKGMQAGRGYTTGGAHGTG